MKLVLASLFLNLFFSLLAQENTPWPTDYAHYHGAYKSDFQCKWVLSNKQRDSLYENHLEYSYCGYFNLNLSRKGTYFMNMDCYRNVDGKIEKIAVQFTGTYRVNASGEVTLNGSHPFDQDKLQIREFVSRKKGKKYITGRAFTYRFNDSYKWIRKGKSGTYCDGCCLTPDECP